MVGKNAQIINKKRLLGFDKHNRMTGEETAKKLPYEIEG